MWQQHGFTSMLKVKESGYLGMSCKNHLWRENESILTGIMKDNSKR